MKKNKTVDLSIGTSPKSDKHMDSRLRTIIESIGLRPRDVVLEVGCGHGVAADLICQKLAGGRLVAIDRSPKMIAAAMRRNASHITAGIATFHVSHVEVFDPGGLKFDVILAIRVGLFHREPEQAQRIVAQWLKPRGRIVAHFDEP